MKPYPKGFPHFETEEQLYALIQEGINSGEGTVMTTEEWRRLYEELGVPLAEAERLAS